MSLKVIEIFVCMKMIEDIISGEGFSQKIASKNDRNTHLEALSLILKDGCIAQEKTLTLLRRGRRTHKTYGDIQVFVE